MNGEEMNISSIVLPGMNSKFSLMLPGIKSPIVAANGLYVSGNMILFICYIHR